MPKLAAIEVGNALPERDYHPTNVSLFLYNAVVWNPHRIHYDEPYTTQIEKHPGIVVDGPLQGDWLTQTVMEWLGEEGELIELEYSNRKASYIGACLTTGGYVSDIDAKNGLVTLDLYIKDEAGDITTPGRAVVRLLS